jgi:hypothetical protein
MKPFSKYIPEENIEKPMEGKRFGERLKWLNSQVNKIQEIINKIKIVIYENLKRAAKRVY